MPMETISATIKTVWTVKERSGLAEKTSIVNPKVTKMKTSRTS